MDGLILSGWAFVLPVAAVYVCPWLGLHFWPLACLDLAVLSVCWPVAELVAAFLKFA